MGTLIDFIIHIDQHLAAITAEYGPLTYTILFLIVFCETGLVVTPLLPGDSLLFAAGTLTVLGSLDPTRLIITLVIAAILGDALNYWIGRKFGYQLFEKERAGNKERRFLKREYLDRTQAFFDKYGNKAIVLARFVPIVRTFAPFMAGVGKMPYGRFATYNVVGALIWVPLFVLAGRFFSDVPIVRNNFSLVILAIIVVSVLPVVYEILKVRFAPQASSK